MQLPRTPSFRLDGRRALVTGASSGIGLGCAVALAEQGAEVSLVARSAAKLEEAVAAMRTEGFSAEALPLDVADVEAGTALAHGSVHGVVLEDEQAVEQRRASGHVTPSLDLDERRVLVLAALALLGLELLEPWEDNNGRGQSASALSRSRTQDSHCFYCTTLCVSIAAL